jgi:redox-sensitive bicupin YhaK (pirin superfamily)
LFSAPQAPAEPIAWGGPIVMNTDEERAQAFDELRRGVFIRHK